jgi:hypothetical protein
VSMKAFARLLNSIGIRLFLASLRAVLAPHLALPPSQEQVV